MIVPKVLQKFGFGEFVIFGNARSIEKLMIFGVEKLGIKMLKKLI
jgi:hypothetical protein